MHVLHVFVICTEILSCGKTNLTLHAVHGSLKDLRDTRQIQLVWKPGLDLNKEQGENSVFVKKQELAASRNAF